MTHHALSLLQKKIRKHPLQLKSFTFKDCGGTDAVVNFNSLVLTPDPLAFPGPLNVAADFKIKSPLNQPLKVRVSLSEKKTRKCYKL